MSSVIELKGLTKRYGSKTVLDQLDLNVEQGTIFGFLGENGAGKTTTIKLLVGLLKPNEGHIQIFGQDLAKHQAALMRRLGALIEAPSYYRHLSAFDNLKILTQLRGLEVSWIPKALKTVGLASVGKAPVKTFSHGMCQRLGIAMAILGEPELVILDEPTNGLDPSGIRDMRELIQSLPQQFGTSIFISSHLLVEIENLADRVGILKGGRLLFEGDLPTLRGKAQKRIILRTPEVLRAETKLPTFSTQAYPEKNLLEIYAPAEAIATITQTLVAESIPILEIREHHPSLEELYFQLTQATP